MSLFYILYFIFQITQNTFKAYNQLEDYISSLKCFLHIKELNKNIIEIYGLCGGIYIKTAQPLVAIEWCEEGLKLEPDNRDCIMNLNTAYRQVNRLPLAVRMTWECLGITCQPAISSLLLPSPLEAALESDTTLALASCDDSCDSSAVAAREGGSQVARSVSESGGVSVVMVKWGTKYGPEYVNKLCEYCNTLY